ncbi:MAG: hypothetical protein JKY27_10970, partial [Magnetovibrio sp.]|nr:hypothetical protein [Magnetovibrio sp.]
MKYTPILVMVLTVAGLMALMVSQAQALTCKAQMSVNVSVRTLDPGPRLSTSQNLKQINSKAKSHGLLKRGKTVLGLTQSKVSTAMSFYVSGLRGGGRTCVNVDRVDAEFGHK